MKYHPKNIPDIVTNNVVYRSTSGEVVAINGELKKMVGASSSSSSSSSDDESSGVPVGDVHGFVKQVVSSNKTEVLRHLLKNGFTNIRLQDLIYLSCQHGCLEMTKLIMDSKQNVSGNYVTKYGWTAVEIASINGHYDVVKMLVTGYAGRADINHLNKNSRNYPLDSAIEGGHFQTVKRMIEELGAEFSPNTKLSQEADAKLEIVQGELIYPGYEYEQILQYLQQKNILPPKVFRALSMSISAFLALKKN